mmetsp:Transcript_3155/g.12668  ORF Transcript_3155/g.12668 Transcript_3155/m.12668 type:complete len:306 (+) Transcript_3155:4231-5148(+)
MPASEFVLPLTVALSVSVVASSAVDELTSSSESESSHASGMSSSLRSFSFGPSLAPPPPMENAEPPSPQPAMFGASKAPICITSPAPRPPISSSELMPIVAKRAAESASVAATPHTKPFSLAHANQGPHTSASRRSVLWCPTTIKPRRARVNITFTRRGSAKKPTLPFAFARVHVNTMTSFSRPWNPSTVETSRASIESGAGGASKRVRRSRWFPLSNLLIARTCAAYGVTMPMSHGNTSWPATSFFTTFTIFCASAGFVCDDPSLRSTPSGTSTKAKGTAGTGQSNPIGARRALGGVPDKSSPL